jgi:hypothetical protein
VAALHSTTAVFTRHRTMTTTTTTPGQRGLSLGWAALFTLAKGLAWLVVLALVLVRLDGLLPRKATASNASMESMESMALAAIADLRAAADAADADLAAAADELEAVVVAPAPVARRSRRQRVA